MSAVLDDGWGGYLVLAGLVVLAHEPWRWLGFVLGRNLTVDSEIFLWVRAVATALVAGLVMKLVVFPAGTLAAVPAWERATALVTGGLMFWLSRRSLAVGVAAGSICLAVLECARDASPVPSPAPKQHCPHFHPPPPPRAAPPAHPCAPPQ